MRATPEIPTPLVRVGVQRHTRSGVPDVVLVAQSATEDRSVLGPGATELGVDEQWLTRYGMRATAGSVQAVPLRPATSGPGSQRRPDHGWLLGTGRGDPQQWRTAGAALVRAASGRLADRNGHADPGTESVQVRLPVGTTAEQAAALALGCVVGSHGYRVTNQDPPAGIRAVHLIVPGGNARGDDRGEETDGDTAEADTAGGDTGPEAVAAAVNRAGTLGAATGLARDLANTPSAVKDPAWLADTAVGLAAELPGLRAVVRDERWLDEHGFGGVLAVGNGSVRPPRLVELSWEPADAAPDVHLVLLGKGVTFDTGGISIKPADGMHWMRTDMSGGAAVIAATVGVARLGLALRLTALVPCAENHVSGAAYRPGDVIRHVDGTTTEVTNADAEGRLVLADALAHAVRELHPSTLVDVATLTGAMKVSLGLRTGGVFATEHELAERVRAAGAAVGEAWWEMPLLADHAEDVRSELADLRQCPPGPGGITAALFLREFTAGLPWAHLDIAGPARAEQSYDEVNVGGTGFATRTLIELACSFTR